MGVDDVARAAAGWSARAAGLLAAGVFGVALFLVVLEAAITPIVRSASGSMSVDLVLPEPDALGSLAERSQVVGPDGVPLATLHGEVNRDHIAFDEVPERVWRAVLAAEDRQFFQHDGYDPEGISRALVSNVQAGEITQGGSTITQQLAKAAVGDEQTLDRKIAELFQAMALERAYDKEELLEHYLNQVYFGAGAYGIAAAAEEFFASEVGELRVEQAALLAAQIRSPARMDPRDNPDVALQRRNAVLAGMVEEGWLDDERAAQLHQLPLGVVGERENAAREPYIVEAVKQEFFSNPAFGDTRGERIDRLFTGGLRITTTIEPDLQDAAERIVRQHFPQRDGVTAAIASVDPGNGRVLAAAFGRDFDREQFNLALQGRRQPGSAFKPFVMTAALEQGLPTDLPVEGTNRTTMGHAVLEPDEHWVTEGVRNYGNASYSNLTMQRALRRSVNTAFAELALLLGIDTVQDLTDRLGIDERAYVGATGEPQRNPSIALGGLARGVTPLEMASAFGVYANDGIRVQPHVIQRVEDRTGEVIYEADSDGERAIDSAVAGQMVDALRGVVTGGTGTAADLPGWPVAGKTGTTQRNRDVWFVGFTPVMSTAVWVGHPDEDVTLPGYSSSGTAAPLWRAFMSEALRGVEPTDYPEPSSEVVNPDQPRDTEVPDVRGQDRDQARGNLISAGLVPQISRVYSGAAPGTVVWQSPDAGTTATFGDQVQLGVSVGPAPPPPPEPDEDDGEAEEDGDSDEDESGDGDQDDAGDLAEGD